MPDTDTYATARIIYDACFLPGHEDGDHVMPPFDEALRDGVGGAERAMSATFILEAEILTHVCGGRAK